GAAGGTGSVTIATPLVSNGSDLAIVASNDIVTAAGAGDIDLSSSQADAGKLVVVAGARFTMTAPTLSIPIGSVGSNAGGMIDLNLATALSTSSSANNHAGGNLTFAAWSGTGSGSGTISLPTAVTATAGGTGN